MLISLTSVNEIKLVRYFIKWLGVLQNANILHAVGNRYSSL